MGASKVNGGKNVEGSGHGRQSGSRHTQPAEQALQTDTAGGLSIRHRPQNTRPTVAGLAAKTTAADDVLPLAVQVSGGSAVVLAATKAGADLPTLSLPHLTPLPVTVPTHSLNLKKTQFSPKLTFF